MVSRSYRKKNPENEAPDDKVKRAENRWPMVSSRCDVVTA